MKSWMIQACAILILAPSAVCLAGINAEARLVSNNQVSMSLAEGQVDAADSVICSDGLDYCQLSDSGGNQPAVHFRLAADQVVHVEADIWGSLGCSGLTDISVVGDLPLAAGDIYVFIQFIPPLPDGTPISITWQVDGCSQTSCQNYVIGQSPGSCDSLSLCQHDGPDVGSCCGVRYLVNPGCPSNVIAGSIPSDYPLDEELDAMATQEGTCPCDGNPFPFALTANPGAAANNVGRPGNRANVSNVFNMDYRSPTDPQPSPFMCGDFAWTADEAAKRVGGFASWQLALYANNYAGHGVNIVKVTPPFATVNTKFCVVEPQSDTTVACWFQTNGDRPGALPQFVINQLAASYPGWTQNRRTSMWSAGQPPNWADPFAIAGMRNRFETQTGYNTANWSRAYSQ